MSTTFKGSKVIKGTIFTNVSFEFLSDTKGVCLVNHYTAEKKEGGKAVKYDTTSKLAYFTKKEVEGLKKALNEVDYSIEMVDLSKYPSYATIATTATTEKKVVKETSDMASLEDVLTAKDKKLDIALMIRDEIDKALKAYTRKANK